MGQLFLKLATRHRRIGRIDPAVDAAWNAQTILGTEDPQPRIELIFVFVDGTSTGRGRHTTGHPGGARGPKRVGALGTSTRWRSRWSRAPPSVPSVANGASGPSELAAQSQIR